MTKTLLHTSSALLLSIVLLAACGPPATPPVSQGSPSSGATTSPSAPSPSPVATPSPAATASPGSLACWPIQGGAAAAATQRPSITDVRVGLHDTYDRLVVEFTTGVPQYRIEPNPWTSPPGGLRFSGGARGDWVTLRGSYGVQLRIDGLDWFHDSYAHGRDLLADYPILREVRLTGDYEGVVTLGVGLGAGACPTVTELQNPPRLVIDFPHS